MNHQPKAGSSSRPMVVLLLLGLVSTLWFLVRVLPKPNRAGYPCMRAAAPFMSAFIIYVLSLGSTLLGFNKFKQQFARTKYLSGSVFLIVALLSFSLFFFQDSQESFARVFNSRYAAFPALSNMPVGTPKGLFPGRVVWVHDADATNENYDPESAGDEWWYSDQNVNQEVVNKMLSIAIMKYAGKKKISEAWDALFKSYNSSHGRGERGYAAGEKIAIKINLTNHSRTSPERMDATPQLLNALLHELTVNAGVRPSDITLGDPYRDFRGEYINLVMSEFQEVRYVDGKGGNGVIQTIPSEKEVILFSDDSLRSTLPQHYLDATYLINIPGLKTHSGGGLTLIAKNHYGSYLAKGEDPASQYAGALHYSMPSNVSGKRKYRHLVDLMGHESTGGKEFLYIIDGIWGGEGWEGWIKKFKSAPFSNDYPNSILVGQDPVALESVCFDILFEECLRDSKKASYPITLKEEIADYLLQCASSDYWPEGIRYDPEGDGSTLQSLGVFEHWNNPAERKYSRNLGTGEGIELIYAYP